MHNVRWGDLEFVLAVAKEGSAAAAARVLGVNHATVIRRVQSFESRWPEPIFEHRREGYRLTPEGQIFLEAAQGIDLAISELERKVAGEEKGLSGHVRITTTDSLFPTLVREIPAIRHAYPDITLDLSMTNIRLDLFNRDADIALRPSMAPPLDLVGRRVGKLEFAIYYHSDLTNQEQLGDVPWLTLTGAPLDSEVGEKIAGFADQFTTVARADSFHSLRQMAESGLGCAFLPLPLGDGSECLKRISPVFDKFSVDLWLLSHKDILRAPRVRVCNDILFNALKRRFKG